jgi:O-antigen/teichoic acid export membrane protein
MKRYLKYIGIDRAVIYTLTGRVWNLLSGFITVALVIRYLNPDEQGYYYTFASLLAMQILFELGMSVVVMQFASHEMAHLSWSETETIEGDEIAKSRLRSLLVIIIQWYGSVSALILVVILPIGWVFFSNSHLQTQVDWQFPWLWLVIAASTNMFFMPFLALLEGCGCVGEIALLRVKQNIVGSLFAWSILLSGGGLLAVPAMNIGFALTVISWLWFSKRKFIADLLVKKPIFSPINWKIEIWPFQWKIGLSWLSGYFIFQLFTPILFTYHGPIEAGQMGISISISSALMSIAIAWMNTKSPGFGSLIAKNDYIKLDKLFNLTLLHSLSIMIIIGLILCVINYIIHIENVSFSTRILSPLPFSLLITATIFSYITYAQSAYLRAHKEEPFMYISIISAIFIGSLSIILGKNYGATVLMLVYASVYGVIGLGCGSLIFYSKKKQFQMKHP